MAGMKFPIQSCQPDGQRSPLPLLRVWGGQAEWKRVMPRGEKQLCVSGVPSGDKLGLSHTVISPVLDTTSALGVTGFMDMSACILYVPVDKEYRAQLLQVHHHPSSSHRWSVRAEHFFHPSSKPRFLPGGQPKSPRFGRNKENPLRVSPDADPRCGMVATRCTSMQILLSPVIILNSVKNEVLITVM